MFIYGGCGGNSNNFETWVECMETCDPDYMSCANEDEEEEERDIQ